jgi:hypothetical protein
MMFKNKKGEDIELERWVWAVLYKDKTYLKQFDEDTKEYHYFDEIEKEKLDVFIMQQADDPTRRFEMKMEEGMEPIHFYRNTRLGIGTDQEQFFKTYCFGYKEKVGGKVKKTILQIFPSGIVGVLNDDGRIG